MFDQEKLEVVFVVRVYEVLNLCHLELTDAQETLFGMDFIPETQSNLRTCKRHSSIIELIQSSEIQKDPLRRLRSQISLKLPGWTNLTTKHQIERYGLRQVVSGVGCLDLVCFDAFVQLLGIIVLTICLNLLVLCLLFRLHLFSLFLHYLIHCFVDQFVRTVALPVLHILDHEVLELVDVTLHEYEKLD